MRRKYSLVLGTVLGLLMTASVSLHAADVATTNGAPEAMPSVHEVAVPAVHESAAERAATPAAEEHAPGLMDVDKYTVITTLVVFIALLIVLRATAWKPILAGLKGREEAIRDSIEAAARAKEEAVRSTKEMETKIAESQRQAAAQMQQAKADATRLADTIRHQAESEATALKERTLRDIEVAKQQALSEINSYAAVLGTSVARKILQRDLNVNDQQWMVDASLSELAKKN